MGITRQSIVLSLLFFMVLFACLLTISQRASNVRAAQNQDGPNLPAAHVSPTPQPSPSPAPQWKKKTAGTTLRRIFHFLACNAAKQTKEQELFQTGMQFPAQYDSSEFSIIALVKQNWAVNLEYELAPGATATITFTVKDIEPFSQTLPARVIGPGPANSLPGESQISAFRLPERFGEKPQAALISLRAIAGARGTPAGFHFYALGIGDRPPQPASTEQPDLQTDGMNAVQVKMAWPGVPPLYESRRGPASLPQAVRIEKVNVTPDVIPIKQGGEFNYTFVSTDKFGAWRADYYKNIQEVRNGKTIQGTHRVRQVKFNELVIAGLNPVPPTSKKWEIKKRGPVPRGDYKIQVTAHVAANGGSEAGKSASRCSDPIKID